MVTGDQYQVLTREFAELSSPDVVLQKEVYAHFGLLFFHFSLVETSLINVLLFHHLGVELVTGNIKSKAQWEQAYDHGCDQAKKKTFGNLSQAVVDIAEFCDLKSELSDVKRRRDYFAHHFFRQEVGLYLDDEGCWHLIWEMSSIRKRLLDLDERLRVPFENMCTRLKLPTPEKSSLEAIEQHLVTDAKLRAVNPPDWSWR